MVFMVFKASTKNLPLKYVAMQLYAAMHVQ